MTSGVYLIHFDAPIAHARHYLGCAKDIELRIKHHAQGNGARLMQVVKEREITWSVANIWETPTFAAARALERSMKRWKNTPKSCAICKEEK